MGREWLRGGRRRRQRGRELEQSLDVARSWTLAPVRPGRGLVPGHTLEELRFVADKARMLELDPAARGTLIL